MGDGRGRRRRGFGRLSRIWDVILNDAVTVLVYVVMAAMIAAVAVGGVLGFRWVLDQREQRQERANAEAQAALVHSGDEIADRLGCEFVRTVESPPEDGTIELELPVDPIDDGSCTAAGREIGITVFGDRRARDSAVAFIDGWLCALGEQFGAVGPFYAARGSWWLVTPDAGRYASDDRQVAQSIASNLDGDTVTLCAPSP